MPALLRRSTALRLCAASIALFALIGVGHVLPAFHFALVVHRVCAAHGELLHLAPTAQAPSHSGDVSLIQRAVNQHERCGVLAMPGLPALPASAPEVARAADTAESRIVLGRALAAHVGIDVLSYAPKRAPPA
jgi:hypothetical protein